MLARMEYVVKERAKSLHFFESISCEDCRGTTDLVMNKYSDAIKCLDCLNNLLEEEAEKARSEQEDYEDMEREGALMGDELRQREKDDRAEEE